MLVMLWYFGSVVSAVMLSKYPSFTPECEGGSIQEKNGDCILRMWNKGGKDVKEI